MQSLFNQKHLAVLANVGTLVRPTTRDQYRQRQVQVPRNLYSHEDQAAQMQTAALDGNMTDGMGGENGGQGSIHFGGSFPIIISLAGTNIFCEGLSARAIQSSGDPTRLLSGFSNSAESQSRMAALQNLLTFDTGVTLIQAASSTTSNSHAGQQIAGGCPGGEAGHGHGLPQQRPGQPTQAGGADYLGARRARGCNDRFSSFRMGGYDTHSDQLVGQNSLFTQLSQAMNAFYQATVEIGAAPQVTAFTLSDFSRTYNPDSTSGTDHAWGGHHLIVGGAVKGGDFYGTFPTLALSGPDDATDQGRWIPTTSLDQYAGTLANWFGVPTADLPTIFPNLPNFSNQFVNFMRVGG